MSTYYFMIMKPKRNIKTFFLNKISKRFYLIFAIILLSNLNIYALGYPLSRLIVATINQVWTICFIDTIIRHTKFEMFTTTIVLFYGIWAMIYLSRFMELFLEHTLHI